MQNIYHVKLKLPVEFVVNESNSVLSICPYTDSHPDLIDFLLSCGISIREAQRFYIPPNGTTPPHVDCNHKNNYAKLNYVFGGQDSIMMWHQLKAGHAAKSMLSPIGTKYLYAQAQDLESEPVFSTQIGFPSLINSGQFHSVINGPEPRICYSFILTYAENPNQNIDWADAVSRLSMYQDSP
jgi:hypothetical protein